MYMRVRDCATAGSSLRLCRLQDRETRRLYEDTKHMQLGTEHRTHDARLDGFGKKKAPVP